MYVPIVKGHECDLKALSQLRTEWQSTKPLIEYTLPEQGTDVPRDVVAFVERLRQFVPLKPTFVDFYGFHPGAPDINGRHPVAAAFDIVRAHGLPITPTLGFDREVDLGRSDQMWTELAGLVPAIGRGCCFRIDFEEIEGAPEETWQEIVERSAQLKLAPSQVDVTLDLRSVLERDEQRLKELVLDFLLGAGRFVPRSVVVAGSSALQTVQEVPENGTLSIERKELRLWADLFADTELSYPLLFGDYGVIYPEFTREGSFSHINAKIRYTAHDKIHYFRGRSYSKMDPEIQYHTLSQHVMASPFFLGIGYSEGDKFIYDCVRGHEQPKQAGPWVTADLNHHLVHTARQIQGLVSSLPGADQEQVRRLISGVATETLGSLDA